MIDVERLAFSYPTGSPIRFPSFGIKQGGQLLLLGESGSGKTTLLHILGGLLRHYEGSVRIDGVELASLSETKLDAFRGQRIGYIFQKNHLISALNVEQNLALAFYLAGRTVDNGRITEVLSLLGLAEKRRTRIAELSQGQVQRVAIARAVLNKPSILFADEPTSALDDKNCSRVAQLLIDAARQSNSTLIIATHDQRLKEKIGGIIDLTPSKV